MTKIVEYTIRLIRAGRRAYAKKLSFLWFFIVSFLCSVAVLGWLDLLPEKQTVAAVPVVVTDASLAKPELPAKIEISKIGISANVVNPTATDIKILDEELLGGAVRYPTSAKLGETGNVVLFGHSSYLPIVKNQAYKTFNGIQKLIAGDVITVSSSNTAYTYRVKSVTKESADNNSSIPLSVDGKVLTLVTCNSFAAKQDRFVVTADFVESHSVSS